MSDFARRLFNNMMLTLISRLAIIAASAFLPVIGFLAAFAFNHAVESFDHLQNKVETLQETTISNQLATIATLKVIENNQSRDSQSINDHEGRIRRIEDSRIRWLQKPGP